MHECMGFLIVITVLNIMFRFETFFLEKSTVFDKNLRTTVA